MQRITVRVSKGLEGKFGAEFYSTAALGARDLAKIGISEISVRIIELRRISHTEGLCPHLEARSLGHRKSAEYASVETKEVGTAK